MKLYPILFEKLELIDWSEYCDLVTKAYEDAPENDPEAQASYAALRDAVKKFFNLIESKVKVEFVDGRGYVRTNRGRHGTASFLLRRRTGGMRSPS